ncbi:hypothetical protein RGCCGE502_19975 [Rhizobium grahamii CCGE 502]|uniref:Transmembrane protein n=1 Tax=Rhizobium grahamii CCGE 502 TaxID=990285 RepID=S3IB32_9HYPH|nr:hypothetical protein RGCCGE502_19975 [Rhizobium grahamii CCGE 502]
MTFSAIRHFLVVLPPALWAVGTGLGMILPYKDCDAGTSSTMLVTLLIVLTSFATTIALRRGGRSRIGIFGTRLEVLLGLSFSFALMLQGAASVLLDPCLH